MWSDNDTPEDLIGFRVHAELIRDVVGDDTVLPVTIGVFGDWGSGKTSIMKMLQAELAKNEQVAVVRLRAAKMPAQFVEVAPLWVLFTLNDQLMFLDGDGALWLETNFRPQALGDDRPRQPVHREAEIVQLA